MCSMPVGDGAIRVTTGLSTGEGADIGLPAGGSGQAGTRAFAPGPAWAAGLTTRLTRLPSLGRVWAGVGAEVRAQADRAFLWTPVAYGLGEIAWRQHDSAEAIRNYQVYLANASTNTAEATNVIARLRELKK